MSGPYLGPISPLSRPLSRGLPIKSRVCTPLSSLSLSHLSLPSLSPTSLFPIKSRVCTRLSSLSLPHLSSLSLSHLSLPYKVSCVYTGLTNTSFSTRARSGLSQRDAQRRHGRHGHQARAHLHGPRPGAEPSYAPSPPPLSLILTRTDHAQVPCRAVPARGSSSSSSLGTPFNAHAPPFNGRTA